MSDLGFDDMDDEEMLDPYFEKPSLDLLKRIADGQERQSELLIALARAVAELARLTGADRETEAVGRDGHILKGKSRIIPDSGAA